MAWRRPGDKPLLEPRMESLLTHICVTRPQWVNLTMDIHISANRLRLGTRRFDLWVANLQMSCSDLTYRQGSRIVGAKVTCPNQTNSVGYECVQLFQKDIICKEVTLWLRTAHCQAHGKFQIKAWPVLLKYGRPVAKCNPWIDRATQGPTIDGPFGNQWIL